jgi:hypothetical protein
MNMKFDGKVNNRSSEEASGEAYTITYYRKVNGVNDEGDYFPEGTDRQYFSDMDPLDVVEEVWYTPVSDLGEYTVHRVLVRFRTIRCGIDELCPRCKGEGRDSDYTGDTYDCGDCKGRGIKLRPDPL